MRGRCRAPLTHSRAASGSDEEAVGWLLHEFLGPYPVCVVRLILGNQYTPPLNLPEVGHSNP